ncbi:MAG TPA: hypothetical protein ENK58_09415 [Desulfobacterales bacterium]|nr:hypothetical protein [Desulfobacterales bacterium]
MTHIDDKPEEIMQLQENTLTKIKRFEHLFQSGHKSVLIDITLNKLAEIELAELRKNLRELKLRISQYETQYGMSSREFSERFDAGELGDTADFIEWFAYADMKAEVAGKINILSQKES